MPCHYIETDREAEAATFLFRHIEGIEYLFQLFCCYSFTGISDLHSYIFSSSQWQIRLLPYFDIIGINRQITTIRHGLKSINNQIVNNLAYLVFVDFDCFKIIRYIQMTINLRTLGSKENGILYRLLEFDDLLDRIATPGEGQ